MHLLPCRLRAFVTFDSRVVLRSFISFLAALDYCSLS